jgi:hypothetical protein
VALRPVSELGLVDLTDLASKPPAVEAGPGGSKPATAEAGRERTTQPRRSSATKRPPAHTARSKRSVTTQRRTVVHRSTSSSGRAAQRPSRGGNRTGDRAETPKTARAAAPTARRNAGPETASPPRRREATPPTRSPRAELGRAVATKLAVTVTYAVAGTAGVLLGRAAVRR